MVIPYMPMLVPPLNWTGYDSFRSVYSCYHLNDFCIFHAHIVDSVILKRSNGLDGILELVNPLPPLGRIVIYKLKVKQTTTGLSAVLSYPLLK